ncbi:MAG: imidazole glycerol phosphate synthase subunit HisF [Sphingomonas hengshuiensis]|uniref:Imidazole glycerol phosphate synthase subunit HisF n=2 Tax=Sphingomonas TaxID=13687 RepID=A0A2W5B767_9SPHN|nr:MAG: imidazole glycerol phosphate synthase subunit HisF [Sphingomonas hengshuiensis]
MYENQPRIIPTLLMRDEGLYKTRRFRDGNYVGDPINTIRIFNQKEVDELILLDIGAARQPKAVDLGYLREIASECFMPLSYGGGIRDADTAQKILSTGVERVIVNTGAHEQRDLVPTLTREFGSSSIIGSIDVAREGNGAAVFVAGGRRRVEGDPIDHCRRLEDMGVGEIMVNAIDRDGELCGYDIDLIERVCASVSVPIIACGGARSPDDFRAARAAGAQAMAAGAMFVFRGKHRAVLIQYTSADHVFGVA